MSRNTEATKRTSARPEALGAQQLGEIKGGFTSHLPAVQSVPDAPELVDRAVGSIRVGARALNFT